MRKPLIALEALMLGIEIEFPSSDPAYSERIFALRNGGLAVKCWTYSDKRVRTDMPPTWLGIEIRVDDFIEMAEKWTDAYTHGIQVQIMQRKIALRSRQTGKHV